MSVAADRPLESRLRVLMVEDDEDDAILTSSALRNEGQRRIEVLPAATISDALSLLRTLPTDVVLLDLFLTDSRGLESLLAIRGESANLPVVVLTGLADERVALEALHHGAQDYLVKGTMSGAAIARSLRYAVERQRLIRERQNAERELRNAHAETQQLLASISSVLIGLDGELCVTKWNAAAEAAFGVAATDVLGKPFAACPIAWHSSGLPEQVGKFRGAKNAARIDEVSFRRGDGSDRVLGLTINPVESDDGGSAGLLLLGLDITERKLLESKLHQARRLESIGQLAGGIAHEINTPIQFIGDNTHFVRDHFAHLGELISEYEEILKLAKIETCLPDLWARVQAARQKADIEYLSQEIPAALSQSLEGIGRVASIVRAMKEFSHPGASSKTPSNVNQLIETTILVARNEWKYVADVATDLDPRLPLVPCLPAELNQVFLNLIINAVHAIGDAGGRRDGQKGTITVTTRHTDDWIEIRVADTGTGIDTSIHSRLFDPFFTTKSVGKGTGQGLAIAHAVIVDRHGGTIDFETKLGQGTTFVVRLPIASPPETSAAGDP